MIYSAFMIFAILAVTVLCIVIGRRIGRLAGSRGWWAGFLIPLAAIFAFGAIRRLPMLTSSRIIRWILVNRMEYVILAGALTLMLVALGSRMKRLAIRRILGVAGGVFVFWGCIGPFALPPLMGRTYANLPAEIDHDGVCLQQTGYTCGAASAVSALHALGIEASEGTIAQLFQTSPAAGTEPYLAAEMLSERYSGQGLRAECRLFARSADLPTDTQMLSVLKYTWTVDHIVAIVRRPTGEIVVSDPLRGRRIESSDQFDKEWRGIVVVMERTKEWLK